jgi:hypothetical protein
MPRNETTVTYPISERLLDGGDATTMTQRAATSVTVDAMEVYLRTFFSELTALAGSYLPAEAASEILYLAYLPAHIVGYVSTQFGAGFELRPASETSISVVRGSRRVEQLLFDAPSAIRRLPAMVAVKGAATVVQSLTFQGALPIALEGDEADVTLIQVRAEALDWRRDVVLAHLDSDRSMSKWTMQVARDQATSVILAATVDLRRAAIHGIPIAEYVSHQKKRAVLLLGSYSTGGLNRIHRLRDLLAQRGYEPILVSEVAETPSQSVIQKVTMLGGMARFVVIDDTEPSGHLVEIDIADSNNWVTAVLRGRGHPTTAMISDRDVFSTVMRSTNYDPANPEAALDEAIRWAEERLQLVADRLDSTYPWRRPESETGPT